MKQKGLFTLILLSVIILVAAITNPDETTHTSKVKELVISKMGLEKELIGGIASGNEWEAAGSVIGYSLGMSLLDKIIGTWLIIDNYVLFSITNVLAGDEKRPIAIGLFGNIFFFNKIKTHIPPADQLNDIQQKPSLNDDVEHASDEDKTQISSRGDVIFIKIINDQAPCMEKPDISANRVSVLDKNSFHHLIKEDGGWYKIKDINKGPCWISTNDAKKIE